MQNGKNKLSFLNKPWLIAIIKILILGGCLYFLIVKFHEQSISFKEVIIPDQFAFILVVVLLLMIFNWYLEALRWKVSLQQFDSISMKKAWQVILGGLALNWVLPFTSGDLLARISQQRDKYQATSAAILNRGIMLCFTLVLGLYVLSQLALEYEMNGWFALVILIGIPVLRRLFKKSESRFLTYFKELPKRFLIRIIGISFVRYLTFVFQFYLLLTAFLPSLPADSIIAGIGWIFLARTALPLFFGGVGVREVSGILFFEPLVSDLQLVIIPIFLIWVINTVVPSLVGLVFVWRMKLTSNYSG
ncbi:lysylphosphatidylglycerol synthase domain-containing protein [Ekhidna sp.]|uniref:lysylphosphatidylglycerol synthase domain-containing protein n=1 Tax=Ekhidna sp. TaxID=2608089 RepID=UPI0035117A88